MSDTQESQKKIAIVMLACRDYKATELALASHMAYRSQGIPFYILQNCRGCYDAERTYDVASRYAKLFPNVIKVIDWIPPGMPYHSITELLKTPEFSEFDLILKVDDDAFPITPNWLDRMLEVWNIADSESPGTLAYVSPLINNNCWGFLETLNRMGLKDSYFSEQAHPHYVGSIFSDDNPKRVVSADQIVTAGSGTIWGYPHIARWLHQRTTLKPDDFIAATRGLSPVEIPSNDRYSIGCILFRPSLWMEIDNSGIGSDDEGMMHNYCKKNGLRIVCARDVPFIHLAYFTQREENRDIVDTAINFYESRLNHPFPISLYANQTLEVENRLRFLENKLFPKEEGVNSSFSWQNLKKLLNLFMKNPKKFIGFIASNKKKAAKLVLSNIKNSK